MESKNVKVIDEHGIDRVANIVCSIDVDGSDYVVYWIERDSDNDNLFISKLIKNNDNTSNMMNIEDSLEKGNLNDIVKELITHAINDDNDKLVSNEVILKNGKKVLIASVLFNKEQNINVQKTYITTVKKSVTKVSEEYYHVEVNSEVLNFENQDEIFSELENVAQTQNGSQVSEVIEPIMPMLDDVTANQVEPIMPIEEPKVVESPVLDIPAQSTKATDSIVDSKTSQVVPESVSVIPEVSVEPPVVVQPEPIKSVEIPNIDARINIIGATSSPKTEPTSVDVPSTTPISVTSAPVENDISTSSTQDFKPIENVGVQVTDNNNLFFDGSKETNLTEAFNEAANEDVKLAVNTVEPIREFGQDEPIIPLINDVQPIASDENTSVNSSGFANNKFFMVIAIVFFLAACVFLGYEVFKYFQMK